MKFKDLLPMIKDESLEILIIIADEEHATFTKSQLPAYLNDYIIVDVWPFETGTLAITLTDK